VTSDVQFRRGASIPPFWVGLGWADLKFDELVTAREQHF